MGGAPQAGGASEDRRGATGRDPRDGKGSGGAGLCAERIAASDRLCIFCGADPHAGTERHARVPAGSPGTSRIVDTAKVRKAVQEKGSKVWRAQLEQHLKDARAYEAENKLEKAIIEWKEVAKIQIESPELMAHIHLENHVLFDRAGG